MTLDIDVGTRTIARVMLPMVLGLIGSQAMAQTIQGTATYRERMALPPGAVFEAAIEDVSRADASATAPANSGSPTPQPPTSNWPVETTYWKAIELTGKPVPAQKANREAHLVFQPGGRASGSDGCNRLAGSYELKGDAITFGQMAGTLMACADAADVEQPFRAALKGASRWKIAGNRLELFDGTGARLAAFEGRPQTPPPATSSTLQGTKWQLVKFQGGDDTTLTPDDKAKYTLEFGAGGRLTARIDCNRGSGTWKSTGGSQLTLGPLGLTRAKCPEGSLHDRIVEHWSYIRSYVIRDGHLFLALMADGGTYEFEPIAAPASPPRS